MKDNFKVLPKIIEFSHLLYRLKTIVRFQGMPGWEDGDWERWDSAAEHSWRMAMLAVLLKPYLRVKIDLLKTLKMILVHDVVELSASDYSPINKHGGMGRHAFSTKAFSDKYQREMFAAKTIFSKLPKELGEEFVSLFNEYIGTKAFPGKTTNEGKFAYALDKIEAVIQAIDWRKSRKNWPREHFEKSMKYLFEWASYDPVLKKFCDMLRSEGEKIIK